MKCKQKNVYCLKKIISFLTGGISLTILAVPGFAQIGSASLQGVVAFHEKPQVGLEVIAKNMDNGYTFRAITQSDGAYIFNGLRPGNYQVFLQNKSGNNPDPIQLNVGQALNLNFQLDNNKDENKIEEVVVIGSQLKSGSSAGEIGTTVSREQMNSLPQNTRNFLAFADLAPGVQFTQGSDGSTKMKAGAQSANAINVFIDGVGQKNYVLGGGVTGQDSSRGNPFPQSAIAQYKVITQNYSAEYDQISSAAIVAVTASGTNQFHGAVFYDFSNQGMREMRPSEIKSGSKVPSKQGQYGLSMGGPIIQDTMHFFFAYEAKNNEDPKDVIAQGGYNKDNLPEEFKSQLGGYAASFKEDLYFGKLDYLISDMQKIELTAKVRKENELTSIGGINTLSYGTDKTNDETRIDLSHNLRTDNWINDSHLTYEDAVYNPHPHTIINGRKLSNNGQQAVLNIGGGRDFQDKGQTGWALQDDFSYLAISDHTIKIGFKYKSIDLHAIEQQPYNPQYEYNIDYNIASNTSLPYAVEWGSPLATIGDGSVNAKNKQLGLYVQDDWKTTDRLTINAGIRWDYEESNTFLKYKTPADVLSGINKWDAIKKSNIDINHYISDGNNRSSFTDAWQPRVGFNYDFSDDNDTALFGGIGRAYDRTLFDYLQLETTNATFPSYKMYFNTSDPIHGCDLTADNCLAWNETYLTREGLAELSNNGTGAGREVYMINNNLKTPYSDQFSFGVRGSLGEWRAEVSLSHILSKDGFAWMLANRRETGQFFNEGSTWGQPWGLGIPGLGNTIIGTNALSTKSNSLFIKLDKPKGDSFWDMTLAYTFTKSTTNRKDGEHYALDYPSITDYGMQASNNLPEHRIVVATSVELPGDIDFSAKLNLQSVESYYGINCRAGWNACRYDVFKPNAAGFLGYKQLDVAFSKNIPTNFWSEGSSLTARFDILNLTNAINYESYNDWYGSPEAADPNFGKPTDDLAGPTLTLKFGLHWKW